MLALAVTLALIIGLSLVPRPISWRKFEVPIAVVGILIGFGLGSWVLALAFSGAGTVAERFAARGVPAPLLLASPALIAVALVCLGRLRTLRSGPSES